MRQKQRGLRAGCRPTYSSIFMVLDRQHADLQPWPFSFLIAAAKPFTRKSKYAL